MIILMTGKAKAEIKKEKRYYIHRKSLQTQGKPIQRLRFNQDKMKRFFCRKKNFITLLIAHILLQASAYALDLSDVNGKLSDIFGSLSDDNEGRTVFRSLNIPVGGRAESLGTAVTGLCDDITFFDYNPAGSAVLSQTEAAFFHNTWIADSAMETIEGTTRFNNLGMGMQLKCFYVPFTEYNLFGDKVAGSYYSETSVTANMAYNFFSGYNFKGLAVGLNLRGTWRAMPDYTDNQTDEIISGSGLEQSALGLMADAGMLIRLNFLKNFTSVEPNLAFGFAVNNIGLAITGFSSGLKLDDPLPTRISAGISYRPLKSFLFTGEIRQPVNIASITSSEKLSVATGMEVNITRFFDFEAGFMLAGANPRFSMGSQFLVKSIKMNVSYTLDLTSSFNPVNHISVAARLLLGDKGRGKKMLSAQAKYAEGLALYAKGTREDIIGAILKWNDAKKIAESAGTKYDPAIEAIRAAQDLLDIHDQINKFGTLEK